MKRMTAFSACDRKRVCLDANKPQRMCVNYENHVKEERKIRKNLRALRIFTRQVAELKCTRERMPGLSTEDYGILLELLLHPKKVSNMDANEKRLHKTGLRRGLTGKEIVDPYRGCILPRIVKSGRILLPEDEVNDCINFYLILSNVDGAKRLSEIISVHYFGISKARVLLFLNSHPVRLKEVPTYENKPLSQPETSSQIMELNQVHLEHIQHMDLNSSMRSETSLECVQNSQGTSEHDKGTRERMPELSTADYSLLLELLLHPRKVSDMDPNEKRLHKTGWRHGLTGKEIDDPYRGCNLPRIVKSGRIILPEDEVDGCINFYSNSSKGGAKRLSDIISVHYFGISKARVLLFLNSHSVRSKELPTYQNKLSLQPVKGSPTMECQQLDLEKPQHVDLNMSIRSETSLEYVQNSQGTSELDEEKMERNLNLSTEDYAALLELLLQPKKVSDMDPNEMRLHKKALGHSLVGREIDDPYRGCILPRIVKSGRILLPEEEVDDCIHFYFVSSMAVGSEHFSEMISAQYFGISELRVLSFLNSHSFHKKEAPTFANEAVLQPTQILPVMESHQTAEEQGEDTDMTSASNTETSPEYVQSSQETSKHDKGTRERMPKLSTEDYALLLKLLLHPKKFSDMDPKERRLHKTALRRGLAGKEIDDPYRGCTLPRIVKSRRILLPEDEVDDCIKFYFALKVTGGAGRLSEMICADYFGISKMRVLLFLNSQPAKELKTVQNNAPLQAIIPQMMEYHPSHLDQNQHVDMSSAIKNELCLESVQCSPGTSKRDKGTRERMPKLSNVDYAVLLDLLLYPKKVSDMDQTERRLHSTALRRGLVGKEIDDPYRGCVLPRIVKSGRILLPEDEMEDCINFYFVISTVHGAERLIKLISAHYYGISKARIQLFLNCHPLHTKDVSTLQNSTITTCTSIINDGVPPY